MALRRRMEKSLAGHARRVVLCLVLGSLVGTTFSIGAVAPARAAAPLPNSAASYPPRGVNPPEIPVKTLGTGEGATPAPPAPNVQGSVTANVDGYGEAPEVAGANVTAFGTSCSTSRPLPSTCPVVNWTTTNSTGGFGMELSPGDYYIAVHPDPAITGGAYPDGFGGGSRTVELNSTANVNLTVYPSVPYGNATLVLPGYVCDWEYLNDVGHGGPGCQNPVLSWTQDGAYYLNATNELVFDSFANRTVYPIAPWTPLYEAFPSYSMIPNQLFITQDGSYVYGWGTLAPHSTVITAEAVNVTTHRVWLYSFAGLTTGAVASNGQVQLTGWDGNDSDLTLIVANRSVYEHDLWSTGQSYVGKFDFFEANNVYWEPYLNGYVNVQAAGSSSDQVEEWQLQGPSNYSLTRTFEGHWGSGRVVNGVNGIALNLTGRALSFGLGALGGSNTVIASVNGSGTITGFASVSESPAGVPPFGPGAASDRPSLLVSGPALGETYDGLYNASWLVELTPGHFGYATTNLSGAYGFGGNPPGYGWSQWSQEGQFYNASYLIAPNSYACDVDFLNACTINGTGSAVVGTVWWYWELGAPEFPFSATTPMADSESPPPTNVTVTNVTSSSADLNWTTAGVNGTVYYSVDWGTSPMEGQVTWLPGDSNSYNLTGLPSGSRVYLSVAAWNLHFAAAGGSTASVITGRLPPPTGLSVTANTSSTLRWSWTQSTGVGVLNDTLYVFSGSACSGLPAVYSTMGPATTETVGQLAPATPYSAYVTAWNASGESTPSTCAAGATRLGGATVTFTESGLPVADLWYANVTPGGSHVASGAVPSVSVALANGTYELRIATNDTRFDPTFPSQFTVNGTPFAVPVAFSPYLLMVTFAESGLPSGTEWWATLGGEQRTSYVNAVVFLETNGTYSYAVSGVPGWHQTSEPYRGQAVVAGAAVTLPLNFSRVTYSVTFAEAGLPNGTGWSVVMNQTTYHSWDGTLVLGLPNGTWSFLLGGVPGYRSSPSSGTVTVNATNLTERVTFARLPAPIPVDLITGAAIAVAAAAVAVVLVVRRRRRRAAGGSPEEPTERPT